MSEAFITDNDKDKVVDYLVMYAKMPRDDQRTLILEWKRYAKVLVGNSYRGRCYLLPGTTHMICKNAIAQLIGKKGYAWDNIIEGEKSSNGLKEQRSITSLKPEVEDALHSYFLSLQELGAPRATRLVSALSVDKQTVNTELKDTDSELIELPSCHQKRALYRGFLLLWSKTSNKKYEG